MIANDVDEGEESPEDGLHVSVAIFYDLDELEDEIYVVFFTYVFE